MNNSLVVALNLLCVIAANIIIWRINLPILRDSLLAMPSAAVFLASVFFTIGLLAFDIPLGILGANNPSTIEKMKDYWWGLPLVFFVIFIISLCVEIVFSRLKKVITLRENI
jgi:hypothetical protein